MCNSSSVVSSVKERFEKRWLLRVLILLTDKTTGCSHHWWYRRSLSFLHEKIQRCVLRDFVMCDVNWRLKHMTSLYGVHNLLKSQGQELNSSGKSLGYSQGERACTDCVWKQIVGVRDNGGCGLNNPSRPYALEKEKCQRIWKREKINALQWSSGNLFLISYKWKLSFYATGIC